MSIFKTDLHNKISDEWLIDLNLMVCYTEREILKKNDDDDDDAIIINIFQALEIHRISLPLK